MTSEQTIVWVVAQEHGLFLSTENYLGPFVYSEPDVECWTLDGDRVVVPDGCYHMTMNLSEAARWTSLEEAGRIAQAAHLSDPDGDYWHPVLLSDAETVAGG